MKKKKSFWEILLQKEVLGLLGGIVICLVISSCAYMSFKEYEQKLFLNIFETEKERVEEAAKEGPISELNDKLSFRFAVDAETQNGFNYIWMEDEETGEVVANSDRGAFIILKDRKTDETSKIYRVDSEYLQPINKYDNIECLDRFYYFWGSDLMYLPRLKSPIYSFRVLNAYVGDGEGYPGTIEVQDSSDIYDDNEDTIDTVTLTPVNAGDYELVKRENDYTIILIYVGNSYVPQIDSSCKKVLEVPFEINDDSVFTTTYDSFFWPGRGAGFGKYRFVDSSGKAYIVHYSGEFYYKEIGIYVAGINLLIMVIAAIIAFIRAMKQYKRENLITEEIFER